MKPSIGKLCDSLIYTMTITIIVIRPHSTPNVTFMPLTNLSKNLIVVFSPIQTYLCTIIVEDPYEWQLDTSAMVKKISFY